jgi:DNA-binding GntR family transcriptional regulator
MDEILDEGRTDAAGHLELADAVVRGDAETAAAVAHRVLTAALVAAGRFMPGSPRTHAAEPEPEPEPEPAGAAAESSRQGPR